MLTWETTVEAQALYARGWTKSAIARHLGINRRTVREYLKGQQVPGQRVRSEPEVFAPFAEYARLRLADDPHLWASTLFDELTALGYAGSYPSFTRALRTRKLRPHCEPCAASRGRDAGLIAHPPGAETQWDWLELPDPPAAWGWSASAHLLVGVLAHSSRWRAVLAEAEDQPQLIEAIDGVIRRLGGVSHRWRFDRMSTVCYPGSGRLTASFAPVAIHYGAGVDICPGRHGNRKGVVEKGNHSLAQRWWRTLPDALSPTQAQAHLDAFCARVGDSRRRMRAGEATTVGALAEAEPLRPPPALPYPATVAVTRTVSAQALVAYRGNRYSVPPGLAGTTVQVAHRLGAATLDIAAGAVVLARHHREPDGAGAIVRDTGHVVALEKAVLAAFNDRAPCRAKVRRPPSAAVGGCVYCGVPASRCPTGSGRAGRGLSRRVRRGHRGRPRRHRGAVMTPAAGDGAAATTMSPLTMSSLTMSSPTMSEAERYQRLRSHLAFLRLPTATEALPEVLDQARAEGWGLLATLERLLAAEVEATEARRLASRLRFACLPAPWRIADFDFSAQPGVDESLIRELATLRFLDTAANLLFLGPGVIPGLA